MNVVFVVVITAYVQIVLGRQMVMLMKMNVMFVMMILLMTVSRIVLVRGVEQM
jgi:hypothetical protein